MTTDVAHVQWGAPGHQDQGMDTPSGFGVSQAEANRMWKVATMLANTGLVAKPLQGNPEAIMGVGLHLVALGIPFSLVGLKQVHCWEDRGIQMQLHYQAHIALMARAGHDAWLAELTDDHATFKVIRGDTGREQTFTYTMAMAKRAGLTDKENWKKHPHYMLPARAAVMATRFACPDALIGLDPETATTTIRPVTLAQIPAAGLSPGTSQVEADEAPDEEPTPSPAPPPKQQTMVPPGGGRVGGEPMPARQKAYDARRARANAAMAGVGIRANDARHEWVKAATDGRTESTAQLSQEDCEAVVAACQRLAEEEAAAGQDQDPGPVEP